MIRHIVRADQRPPIVLAIAAVWCSAMVGCCSVIPFLGRLGATKGFIGCQIEFSEFFDRKSPDEP